MFKMFREIRKAKQETIKDEWLAVMQESIAAIHAVHDGKRRYASVPMRTAKPERIVHHLNDIIAQGGYAVSVKVVKKCYVFSAR